MSLSKKLKIRTYLVLRGCVAYLAHRANHLGAIGLGQCGARVREERSAEPCPEERDGVGLGSSRVGLPFA
jgi:hypothetical protein